MDKITVVVRNFLVIFLLSMFLLLDLAVAFEKGTNLSPEAIFKQAQLNRSRIQSIEIAYSLQVFNNGKLSSQSTTNLIWKKPNFIRKEETVKTYRESKHIDIFDGKIEWWGWGYGGGILSGLTKIDLSKFTKIQRDKFMSLPYSKFYGFVRAINSIESEVGRLAPDSDWKFERIENDNHGKVYFLTGDVKGDVLYKKAKLWIGCEDGLAHKSELYSKEELKNVYVLEKIKINSSIPDIKFTYMPPPNVEVFDITNDVIKQLMAERKPEEKEQEDFAAELKALKGEIVYLHRDNEILNVYKISANGRDKKLLYHNEDKVNSNCLFPKWSEDGSRILFAAMKNGKWSKFSVDENGKNVLIEEFTEQHCTWMLSRKSRSDSILVEKGSVHCVNDTGKRNVVYVHKNSSADFNGGAYEASWSPDHRYVIFHVLGEPNPVPSIFVADRKGSFIVRITEGQDADWKY